MGTAAAVAFRDLFGSIQRLPLAFSLAASDINGKYRRTVLGPLWIVLGQAATIVGFIVVFSGLFGLDPRSYALYLAAGFPVWALISSYLTDMPNTFISAKGFIESFELPWLLHIWRRSIGYVLVFAHHLVTLFVVMVILGAPPRWEMLYVIPGTIIVMIAGSGLGTFLGVVGARYRDLQHAMGIAAGFLFLFSPVMWRAEQLRMNEWVVHFNPFYYMITLLRDPLLGRAPSPEIWIGTGVAAAGLMLLGFLAFYMSRKRLYHWL